MYRHNTQHSLSTNVLRYKSKMQQLYILNTSNNNKTQESDNKAVEDSSPEEPKLVYQEVSISHLVPSLPHLPPPHLPLRKTNITDLKNKVLCSNIYLFTDGSVHLYLYIINYYIHRLA